MSDKFCNYLFVSLLVNIVAIVTVISVIIAQIIFFFINPELLKNRIVASFLLIIGVLFILGEFYANWFFKKMEIEENYYLNNSLLIYKRHRNLCQKLTK